MNAAICTRDLVKKFNRVTALDNLNLDVPEGSIYALVGPNGAGKTTAIKVFMNIFPPTSGNAMVLGMDSRRVAGRAFRSIGYVSESQELPGWLRIDEFLTYLRPFYPTWDRTVEERLAKHYRLPLERKISKLSRGVRMKAVLVSALAYHPRLIVLDEPFGGLDPLVREELIEGLQQQASEATIFVASHDLAEIEDLASHVAYLEQGRLRFSESLEALVARFREVELTFDAPPASQPEWQESWMEVETSGARVRFVESRFEEERTRSEIAKVLGGAREITFTPMPLRSIFLAMARAGRGSA